MSTVIPPRRTWDRKMKSLFQLVLDSVEDDGGEPMTVWICICGDDGHRDAPVRHTGRNDAGICAVPGGRLCMAGGVGSGRDYTSAGNGTPVAEWQR